MVIGMTCEKLELKCEFKVLILNYGTIIIGSFIPTHYVNYEVVDKHDFFFGKRR